MHTIGVSEARKRLTALLQEVTLGGEALITRRGRPIARLVSARLGFDRDEARRAAEGLRAASRGQSLGGLSLNGLIGEGRR